MKLWIFGDSLSLPTNVPDRCGWPTLLCERLGCEMENWANEASDNLYIYHCYRSQRPRMSTNDAVLVGWSHPSRKTFVYDIHNPMHTEVLRTSIVYDRCAPVFFRSCNRGVQNLDKWKNLSPKTSHRKFYDDWFQNYYSDYEQRCLLESFCQAVASTAPGIYVPWFFSQQSIESLALSGHGTMLEFIRSNNYSISDSDAHLNEAGHRAWADHLFTVISRYLEND